MLDTIAMSLFYTSGFWSNDATTIFLDAIDAAIFSSGSLLSAGDLGDLKEFWDLGDLLKTGGVTLKLFFCLR